MSVCDRCGVRGKAQIVTPSGTLVLCGHHLTQHADALALYAVLPLVQRAPQRV